MCEEQIPASRLHFSQETTVSNTTLPPGRSGLKKAAGEKPVLYLLEKYGFMNLHMIAYALKIKGHKTVNVNKTLKRMQEQGMVLKYTYTPKNPDLPQNDVYALSKKARDDSGLSRAKRSPHDYNASNIPYVYEKLALCQWHLKLLAMKNTKEVMFQRLVGGERFHVLVPSLVSVKTRLKKRILLCALPVARGRSKDAVINFLAQIVFLLRYFAENRKHFHSPVIILLAESFSQIEDVACLLHSLSETKDLYVLYAVDSLVSDDEVNPLKMLYQVREEGRLKALDLVQVA